MSRSEFPMLLLYSSVTAMKNEDQICRQYEAELASIAILDRSYYLNPHPSRTERSDYAARQERLEEIRLRLYAELASLRYVRQFRRCRSIIRRSTFLTSSPSTRH